MVGRAAMALVYDATRTHDVDATSVPHGVSAASPARIFAMKGPGRKRSTVCEEFFCAGHASRHQSP